MSSPNKDAQYSLNMETKYLHDLHLDEEVLFSIEVTVTRKWAETTSDNRVHGMNLIFVDKYVSNSSILIFTLHYSLYNSSAT